MTDRKSKLEKALAYNADETVESLASVSFEQGRKNENRRLQLLHAALIEAVEALEMGAFHHPACGWYDGKECHCANSKCKEALAKIDKALEGMGGK